MPLQPLHCPMANTNFHGRDSACSLLIGQTITLLYIIIVVPASLIITLHGQNCNAQRCNSVNHTKGSEFESNLNTVLNSLVKNTCQTGFNTSVYGQSPDQIYGLLQCRSDATVDECHKYSQNAAATIRESCGNSIGGSFWGDCFLRFENNSFIGKMETDGWFTYRIGNISNPDVFTAAVEKLLYKLTGEVKSGSAYGTAVDSQFRRIYAKVYCTRDISADDCTTCLSNTINYIQVVYPGNMGVQGLMQSCFIRYEIYNFFNVFAAPPAEAPTNTETTPSRNEREITPVVDCKYTDDSKFQSNLNSVLKSLVQYTSPTGFTTSEYGQIYGLLQCRGDTTVDQCHSCSLNATATLQQKCGYAGSGRIWLTLCYLRYENYNFIGQLDTAVFEGNVHNGSTQQNVSLSEVFNTALGSLLNHLSDQATSGSKWNRYASGTTRDSLSRKIYAFVQCTRDIATDDCTTCLSETTNYILSVYSGMLGAQALTTSCIVRYEIFRFINSTTPSFFNSIAPPPLSAEAPSYEEANTPQKQITKRSNNPHIKHSKKTPIISGVAGGLILVLLVCLFAGWKRLKYAINRRGYEGHGQVEEEALMNEDQQIVFKMETLLIATENFHDDNKLGEGGFGPVYKGTTEDGKEIAVKKLSINSLQGKKEFMNEVKLVAQIQHRNLVKLLGYCAEGSETSLVYEYLPNKSLDKILFDPNRRNQLDWHNRYNIILGIARGLLYLHQDSHLRIIHRDIKASNILLDEKLNPKIADFGLARLFPEDESHVSTKVAGTFGYMAPEYALHGQLTVKADIYSFGVLLLEIVTGRKHTDCSLSPESQILLGWAWRSYEGGNIVQMIDGAIIETCDETQASRCIHVGLLCTQAEASLRPRMSTATLMLSSESATLPLPTKPAFFELSSNTQNTTPTRSGSGSSHASSLTPLAPPSNADCSITGLEPR